MGTSSGKVPPPCFPEPEIPNTAPRGWSPIETARLLASSTLPDARSVREFLNRSLDALPPDAATNLCHRLHADPPFERVFFEMLVGRFLQVLGAEVVHEPVGLGGLSIDWRATFPDGRVVYVEATSPEYNRKMNQEMAGRQAMVAIIEAQAPAGWWIAPKRLPGLGLHEARCEFKQAVRSMYTKLPIGSEATWANPLRLEAETTRGPLVIDFWPGNPTHSPIRSVWLGGGYDDSALRVAVAAADKRRQARAFPGEVVLLAVDGPLGGPDVESFDDGLFGHEVVHVAEDHGISGYSFRRDGALARQRAAEYAGVLAFLGVNVFGAGDPILYVHPRYGGSFPGALLSLRRRSLAGSAIMNVAALRSSIVDGIGSPSANDE
jgi:hypothetical protein